MITLSSADMARTTALAKSSRVDAEQLEKIEQCIRIAASKGERNFYIHNLSVFSIGKLKDAGYTVEHTEDPRDGDLYLISF